MSFLATASLMCPAPRLASGLETHPYTKRNLTIKLYIRQWTYALSRLQMQRIMFFFRNISANPLVENDISYKLHWASAGIAHVAT